MIKYKKIIVFGILSICLLNQTAQAVDTKTSPSLSKEKEKTKLKKESKIDLLKLGKKLDQKQIIGIKGDSIAWLYNKHYKKYFPKTYNIRFIEFFNGNEFGP